MTGLQKLILFLFLLFSLQGVSQDIVLLDSLKGVSLRGLCPVDDRVIWASGSKGYVVRSTDGGKNFRWKQVPGYEQSDFRDIEAFDSLHAVIMSSGTPAVILRTVNGGRNWTETYRNNDSAYFLDAMAWMSPRRALVLGDPLNGRFLLLATYDSGKTWQRTDSLNLGLEAAAGEAAFAASGSCIRKMPKGPVVIATGGTRARVLLPAHFHRGTGYNFFETPMIQGAAGTGIFSVAFRSPKRGVIAGGDYTNDTLARDNFFYTKTNGNIWIRPKKGPGGYRSCAEYISKRKLIVTGPGGTDISRNGCRTWKPLTKTGFHVVRKAKAGKRVFFSGSDGRIAVLR